MTDTRRSLPSVDGLLRSTPGRRAAATVGRPLLKQIVASVLDEARALAADGESRPDDDEILAAAIARASRISVGMRPVINATGVILHTNLGRAPMPERAVHAAAQAGRGYADLEVDRESGARGRRSTRAEAMLTALTGAQDALVVNNCAAALMLSLAALAKGKQVLVSRGELIEIGGEFRIPDIVAASGAKLVEVGTTNRTRIGDYRSAFTDRVGAVLKVHPSNYRVVGFTASTSAKELAAIAARRSVPFLYDVGSGLLRHGQGLPPDEPAVTDAIAEGADIVTFSGDKLLGGPQAGMIVGRADLVDRIRRHPIARAVRVDTMQVAALEQVLAMIATGADDEIPVTRMLREPAESVRRRAQRLSETVGGDLEHAQVHRCESAIGGGATPGIGLPSWGVRVTVPDPNAFAARLRTGRPSVFCRVERDHVLFDLRTVTDAQVGDLARAIWYALEGDDLDDED
jgi:L-seryl-tRNA(Ser) seleniumtransferase